MLTQADHRMTGSPHGDELAHGMTISLRRSLDELRALSIPRDSHESCALRAFDILRNAVRQ